MEHVPRILRKTEDPNGRAACLWLIGTFPDFCADAPYIIEPLIDVTRSRRAAACVWNYSPPP